MSRRTPLTYITGALAIFGATCVQAATTYTSEMDFMTGIENIGFLVEATPEGFDDATWGIATDLFAGGKVAKPNVSNQGITWMPLDTTNNNVGFATSDGGGNVHNGTHQMFAIDSSTGFHPVPDGYTLSVDNANKLYAVGGWFKGNNAKLAFYLDGELTAESIINGWTFLGFIETDQSLGFNSLKIQQIDETGDETRTFFSDTFTFAGTPGTFTPSVPLPAALPLFGSALLGAMGIAWRRRRV